MNSINIMESDSIPSTASPISSAPICRRFWKAGNYDEWLASKLILQNATGYLHIHPKFLHSNATSHKWVFGAIAELLDNAVDEAQRGGSLVTLDKMSNPRDGNPALLIQDDGGGMDPDAMRRCLSFGFSNKKSKSAIGQYGNGFKTSTMRLGADAIVFTRGTKERKLTQSVGLLSYTYLMRSGHDRIVVPMVDYEFDESPRTWKALHLEQNFVNNMSLLLRWSPYSTESELLNQLEAVGSHGTRIIIYNLWCNDDGQLELDFDTDPEDIRVNRDQTEKEKSGPQMAVTSQHLANRLRYSLRAYLSILYLRIPNNFSMLLRGRVIEYHTIANDLKHPEYIVYKPHSTGNVEGSVVTTIGFLNDAPLVNIHGFNVYHRNRLVLPFWHVVSYSSNRGRGVVGVLEANFIEPMHNKQEFEKTPVFQKLEHRLKQMTLEYWDHHCELIGYQVTKKPRVQPVVSRDSPYHKLHGTYTSAFLDTKKKYTPAFEGGSPSAMPKESDVTKINQKKVCMSRQTPCRSKKPRVVPLVSQDSPCHKLHGTYTPVFASGSPSALPKASDVTKFDQIQSKSEKLSKFPSNSQGAPNKRRDHDVISDPEIVKRKARLASDESVPGSQSEPATIADQLDHQKYANLLQENQKLQRRCLESEKRQEELNNKLKNLTMDLKNAQSEYANLLVESKALEKVKKEKNVCM